MGRCRHDPGCKPRALSPLPTGGHVFRLCHMLIQTLSPAPGSPGPSPPPLGGMGHRRVPLIYRLYPKWECGGSCWVVRGTRGPRRDCLLFLTLLRGALPAWPGKSDTEGHSRDPGNALIPVPAVWAAGTTDCLEKTGGARLLSTARGRTAPSPPKQNSWFRVPTTWVQHAGSATGEPGQPEDVLWLQRRQVFFVRGGLGGLAFGRGRRGAGWG